jgi:uncharacterized protein involved in response to NO
MSFFQLTASPFRIFFFVAGVWAVLAVPLWLMMLFGVMPLPTAMPSILWHQHEMLFGWLHAAIAGFLLTAVCVWTQTERLHGWPLLGLVLVWLTSRGLMLVGGGLPEALVMGVNLAFLPLVMLDAGRRIVAARQWRQLILLGVLAVLWASQLGFWLGPHGVAREIAMLAVVALMLVIGGRITPAFTAGWLRIRGDAAAERVGNQSWLERAMLALLVVMVLAFLAAPPFVVAILAALLAVVVTVRIALWRGWRARAEPLLWMLHVSLAWIPPALLLLAAGQLQWLPATAWFHAAGVGAMSGLILGVMARVILGHTGRPLVLPRGMPTAFVLLHIGALLRVGAAVGLSPWMPSVLLSAALWVMAFLIFVVLYTPLVLAPRIDGRVG